jgi:hypothetical protein
MLPLCRVLRRNEAWQRDLARAGQRYGKVMIKGGASGRRFPYFSPEFFAIGSRMRVC